MLADRYKDLTVGRLACYNNLCALIQLFLFSHDTLSETVRNTPWTHSVSDLSRAVHDFNGNRFMRRYRESILRKYKGIPMNPDDFCFAIDDTDNPKYGKNTYRNGRWRSSKGPYIGQKILVVALVDIKRGFSIPLSYAFVPKKDDPEYKSGLDLSVELLSEILVAGFPRLKVVTDSWFDSAAFIADLKELGLEFAGEIKGNRNVKDNPGPTVKWKKLPQLFKGVKRYRLSSRFDSKKVKMRQRKGKCAAEKIIMIKNFKSPLKCIAVYNRRNGKNAFAYYVSTDLSLTGAQLWEFSRARWKIECLFYDLKQNLSFGRLPCAGKEGADLAVCLPMLIYTSLRLDDAKKWGLEEQETIGTMVDKIKEKELTKSINTIIRNPKQIKVSILGARRKLSHINKKPVNKFAEKTSYGQSVAA